MAHTKEALEALDKISLRKAAKAAGIDPAGKTDADLVRGIMKAQSGATPADPTPAKKAGSKRAAPAEAPPAEESDAPPAEEPPPPVKKAGTKAAAPKAAPTAATPPATKAAAKAPAMDPSVEARFILNESRMASLEERLATFESSLASEGGEVAPAADESGEEPGVSVEDVQGMDRPTLLKLIADNGITHSPKDSDDILRRRVLVAMEVISDISQPAPWDVVAEDDAPPAEEPAKNLVEGHTRLKLQECTVNRVVAVYLPEDPDFGNKLWRGIVSKDDTGKFFDVTKDPKEVHVSVEEDGSSQYVPVTAIFDGAILPQKEAAKAR